MGKTPKKQDIIERAFELHHKGNHNVNSNNPEVNEVKESGFYEQAKRELMTSESTEYLSHLEKECAALGYRLTKEKVVEGKQRVPDPFEVDIEELLRSGCFIAGGKGSTKSNLGMTIADRLMRKGIIVKVFDISKAWQRSSIPYYVEIGSKGSVRVNLYESCIFDLSRLLPKEAKRFIAQTIANEWNLQVSIPEHKRRQIVYVFEEVQVLVPQGSLRSNEAQQVLRLMTTGRNYKLGYVAITQRPALTDTSVFELTFQRYFARMDGQNDLRKVGSYIGYDNARQLQNLKLGQFIYDMGSEAKWITTKEFHSKTKPQASSITRFTPSVAKRQANPNSDTIGTIMFLLGLIGFGMCIGALLI